MVTTEPRSAPQHPREGEVVAALRERTALTRAEIAETTGLSRSTVSSVLGTLLEEGAVVVAGYDEQPGRGRPTERVQIDRRVVRSARRAAPPARRRPARQQRPPQLPPRLAPPARVGPAGTGRSCPPHRPACLASRGARSLRADTATTERHRTMAADRG